MDIPSTVATDVARALYARVNGARADLKAIAADVQQLRVDSRPQTGVDAEVIANVTLAYRHIEDASMRLGKALQSLDGGVSVYDKATTVGAPDTRVVSSVDLGASEDVAGMTEDELTAQISARMLAVGAELRMKSAQARNTNGTPS